MPEERSLELILKKIRLGSEELDRALEPSRLRDGSSVANSDRLKEPSKQPGFSSGEKRSLPT